MDILDIYRKVDPYCKNIFIQKFMNETLDLLHESQLKMKRTMPVQVAEKKDFVNSVELRYLGNKQNFLGFLFGIKIYSNYLFYPQRRISCL